MTRVIHPVVLILGLLVLAPPGSAQQVERIAAIVNDEVISFSDLDARIRMVILTSDLDDGPQTRQRIAPQVLRALIDERLQLQESKRRSISVSEGDMKEAYASIERDNSLRPGEFDKFVAENKIPRASLVDQIRANVAWAKLIGRRIRPTITVGEDEIDEVLERLKSRRGQPEYRIAEIFLTVDSPRDEEEVRRAATRLTEQIRAGARFDQLARQFSQSASAAVGGDTGWIQPGVASDELIATARSLRPNQVSDPIRTLSGYQLVRLLEVRTQLAARPEEIKLDLRQIFLSLPAGAPQEAVEARLNEARAIGQRIDGCASVQPLAEAARSTRPVELGTFRLSDLAPNIQKSLADVTEGRASEPVTQPDGVLLVIVCKRDAPPEADPKREEIGRGILGIRVDLAARRYLRDIRLSAIVDVRV